MDGNKDVNALNALVSVTGHKKVCTLAMQPQGKENVSNPVGMGMNVITDLYKPLTIQKRINLVFKTIHRAICNNIQWQIILYINNSI
jgi:hypothetical protein